MNDADTTNRVVKRAPRRRHGSDFKAQVLHACRQPGASVAAIAREHGLNANVVHRWRASDSCGVAPSTVPSHMPGASDFLAVGLLPDPHAAAEPTPLPDIRIELQRGATTAVVRWPVQAAASCAAWLRALLAPMTSSSPAGGPA